MTSQPVAVSRTARVLTVATMLLAAAPLLAFLVVGGQSAIAAALVVAIPTFVLLYRQPMVAVGLWLLIGPFVVETSGGALRKVFWLVHRGLPLLALIAVCLAAIHGKRKLPRLGWAELAIAAYAIAGILSIAYTSSDGRTTFYLFYDRVLAPMFLYLLVRLIEPTKEQLRRLLPAMAFLVITQTVIGATAWMAPGLVPEAWQGRLGTRTIGSLGHPNVFGVALLTAALFLIHSIHVERDRTAHRRVLFTVALVMVFLTFSRASWVAGLLVLAGLLVTYRRFTFRFIAGTAVVVSILLAAGTIGGQLQLAQDRLQSEESALSRLPVYYASIRMFAAKPLAGWGYGNFDLYDREFQAQVGDLVYPEKDHASHNLYLTLLAEQGLLGFWFYLFPLLWWASRYKRAKGAMEVNGFINQKLLAVLWLALLAHLVVNNFSNMRVEFGLGLWWLTLGLIASLEARSTRRPALRLDDGGRLTGLLAGQRLRIARTEEKSWNGP